LPGKPAHGIHSGTVLGHGNMPGTERRVIDWEHLAVVLAILGFLAWYLSDAALASPTFSNLILIAPIGACAAALALFVGVTEILNRQAPAPVIDLHQGETSETAPSRFRSGSIKAILLLMGLFAIYVAAIPYAGFDVASFFFIAGTLWLLGERRVLMTLAIALGVSAGISLAALTLLTVPVPLGVAPIFWSAL
jgi:hypothetical protein